MSVAAQVQHDRNRDHFERDHIVKSSKKGKMSSSGSSSISNPSADSGIGLLHPPKVPFLIGVAGGTASGKFSVCRKIMDRLGKDAVERQQRVVCISQDSFYRELNQLEKQEALKGNYNFDHPDALDVELMQRILQDILRGKEVQIPVYDFALNMRYDSFILIISFPPTFIICFTYRKTEEFKRILPADVGMCNDDNHFLDFFPN